MKTSSSPAWRIGGGRTLRENLQKFNAFTSSEYRRVGVVGVDELATAVSVRTGTDVKRFQTWILLSLPCLHSPINRIASEMSQLGIQVRARIEQCRT